MFVAAVKIISTTPADLLTIVSVSTTIGGGNLNSVNLSHTYIRKHFNKITKAVSSTIRQKWTGSKTFWCIGTTKLTQHFNDLLIFRYFTAFTSL